MNLLHSPVILSEVFLEWSVVVSFPLNWARDFLEKKDFVLGSPIGETKEEQWENPGQEEDPVEWPHL
jgi:hypothetical protein